MPAEPGARWSPACRGVLVIGYGNELRGDDAAGPAAARALGARGLEALAVPQLTPELAERIAAARAVIFLDSDAALAAGEATVAPVLPSAGAEAFEHHSTPAGLLHLARLAYGAAPPAWLISMGGARFDLGARLSPEAQRAMVSAIERAVALTAPG